MREGAIDTNQTKRRPDVFSVRLRQRHRILAESLKACSLKRVCSTHGCNQEGTTKSRPNEDGLFKEIPHSSPVFIQGRNAALKPRRYFFERQATNR